MKHLITLCIILSLLFLTTRSSSIKCLQFSKINRLKSNDDKIKGCKYKGFKLYGKIKVVHDFPDLKVQVVENFPDLKIKIVQNFPDECGKWEFVEDFPDIKIQFVENFPDIKVKFVENFPGIP